ncbi:hypothetical protein JCGZ_02451 [Jatropha curcas]|uniref:Uncharacterized protein n=1 Tax=Jatropha curcas TaxID=180498 RepID=A0A067LE77_JATCU|nr:hypothetical protein JCGZ_02451 [Jatropha curcas]
MNPTAVQHISESFIKPQHMTEETKHPYYLSPCDLGMVSACYIQRGLLFAKPTPQEDFKIFDLLEKLKHSLALTLVHFYPLAGRLATSKSEDPPSYVIYVDCSNSPGARFVHATVEMTVSDILSPTYVPSVVQSFFDHHRALNHEGHVRSLLTIQVTELIDGIFIGCSFNHVIGDGTSYWHFLNTWSEIFQAQRDDHVPISQPPVLKRWFPDNCGPIINLPFTHHEQFLVPFEAPLLKERIFHFSAESIAKLKVKANTEYNTDKISSFQSLSAFMWRCITRARHIPHDQVTHCSLACNNRSRLNPPLSPNYFGNFVDAVSASTTGCELLEQNLGWAAWLLHQAVINQTDKKFRDRIDSWIKSPIIYHLGQFFGLYGVVFGSSPRFSKYGCEFGLGKALSLRSGYANKFCGKVSAYPGREGGGSVDLEVCLLPDSMTALESDKEFMAAVS